MNLFDARVLISSFLQSRSLSEAAEGRPTPCLKDAIAAFRQKNYQGAKEAAAESWTDAWSDLRRGTHRSSSAQSAAVASALILSGCAIAFDKQEEAVQYADQSFLLGCPRDIFSGLLSAIGWTSMPQQLEAAEFWRPSSPCHKSACPPLPVPLDPSRIVPTFPSLSLHDFGPFYERQLPVVISGSMQHWPLSKMDPKQVFRFLSRTFGQRMVPVEVGANANYAHQGWREDILRLDAFLGDVIDDSDSDIDLASRGDGSDDAAPPHSTKSADGPVVTYMAQHPLFDQIPELASMVEVPIYCSLGTDHRLVNAWIGPAGTVTPLHFDSTHNCLVQIAGHKYVRLYAPELSDILRPNSGSKCNSSTIDFRWDRSPQVPAKESQSFLLAPYVECVLGPGDLLFLPANWWHYVHSLSSSFSISFWFAS